CSNVRRGRTSVWAYRIESRGSRTHESETEQRLHLNQPETRTSRGSPRMGAIQEGIRQQLLEQQGGDLAILPLQPSEVTECRGGIEIDNPPFPHTWLLPAR